MKPAIPSSVVVLGHRYRVREVEDSESVTEGWVHAPDSSGSLDHEGVNGIRLDSTLGPDYKATVLLHEVLHAVFFLGGVEPLCPKGDEEPIVKALAPLLRDTLRRNPRLVAYIMGRDYL